MKMYEEWRYSSIILDGTSWRSEISFTPLPIYVAEKAPRTNWTGGWMESGAGLDTVEYV
jgi:hypothetical protein